MHLGAFARASEHVERRLALYDIQHHRSHAFLYGQDPGISCLIWAAILLWYLGYPDQSLRRVQEALSLAQGLAHPHGLAFAQSFAATLHQLRQEAPQAQKQAEASIALCREQGFAFRLARGTILRGWVLSMQGQHEEGLAQMRQGVAAHRAAGIELGLTYYLALLAEGDRRAGQADTGLAVLAEALATAHKTGERWWEAELYRLKGELLLQSRVRGRELQVLTQEAVAEQCFHHALAIARQQQAKSWKLRAAMSLARLWQQQGKRDAARQVLATVYDWFREGFDTVDLRTAKVLLEELSR